MQNIFKPSWNGYPIIFLIETVVRKLPFLNRDAIKTINDGTERPVHLFIGSCREKHDLL